jgi:DNA-binding CsgD family transcriptional regulator
MNAMAEAPPVCPTGVVWYKTVQAYIIYGLLLWFIILSGIRQQIRKKRKRRRSTLQFEWQLREKKIHELRNEMLEKELQNKKNELMQQAASMARKNRIMKTLLEELERQKETLGHQYPDKLYLRMRTLMEKTLNTHSDRTAFEHYFNSAHQDFIKRFREQYKDITSGDLRICCLLRMNLSTKEIASILHVSVRAVELRRYRLRKRIGLESDTNLVDFLMGY